MMNDMGVRLGVPLQESDRAFSEEKRPRVTGRPRHSTLSGCGLRAWMITGRGGGRIAIHPVAFRSRGA
jgi:hypothetical protein